MRTAHYQWLSETAQEEKAGEVRSKSLANKEVMNKNLDIAWACGTATFNQAVLKAKF